jgi:hypothetical protein
MTLFALDPWWSDFYTVGGFVAGVLGCIVGVAGFAYTIYQVRKVKAAAEAARDAATKTLQESKASYERFVGDFGSQLLSELRRAVQDGDWKVASFRAHDLAELLASLHPSGNEEEDTARSEIVREFRAFGDLFAAMDKKEKKPARLPAKSQKEKWEPLLASSHQQLDRLRRPFRERTDGEITPSDPPRETQGDCSKPPYKDEGTTGELGSEASSK